MVDFSKMQDTINPKTGELVIRSKDCQEVPAVMIYFQCILSGYWTTYLPIVRTNQER